VREGEAAVITSVQTRRMSLFTNTGGEHFPQSLKQSVVKDYCKMTGGTSASVQPDEADDSHEKAVPEG
jgi:hypothetical protein